MSTVEALARIEGIQQLVASAAAALPPRGGGFQAVLDAARQTPATGPIAAPVAIAPVAATATAGAATPYAAEIDAAAARYGVDPALLRAVIKQESDFDPGTSSSAGALGLTQLMPDTIREYGITDPLDPVQNIEGGARHLREQLDAFGGDVVKGLAAYNAGAGAVRRFGGIPPYAETQAYVPKVLGYADEYRRAAAPTTVAVTPYTGTGSIL